jgi:heat shock transcription factor
MADTAGDQFMSNWNDTMSGDMSNAFNSSSFLTGLNEFTDGFGAASGPSTHNRIVSLDGMETGTAGHDNSTPGQLVRRNPNQQLAARGTPWEDLDSNGQQGWPIAEDDDEELEQKALLAKKDAQAKRKQIPPFVQKLSR